MNLFKLVDKMHDKQLFSHYLHCTAYHIIADRFGVPLGSKVYYQCDTLII